MYTRILVPLDGSRAGNVAADHAIEIARHFGASVVFIRVVSPGRVPVGVGGEAGGMGYGPSPVAAEMIADEMQAEERRNVQRARRQLSGKIRDAEKFGVSSSMLTPVGDPAASIVRAAQQEKADLIVMTTRARRGIRRALLGSVADEVIKQTGSPVLVIRRE